MKCPHNHSECDIDCHQVDTSGMDKPIECKDCENYSQATGAVEKPLGYLLIAGLFFIGVIIGFICGSVFS